MKDKDKRPIYEPPKARDISAISVSGVVGPCQPGSYPYGSCLEGGSLSPGPCLTGKSPITPQCSGGSNPTI